MFSTTTTTLCNSFFKPVIARLVLNVHVSICDNRYEHVLDNTIRQGCYGYRILPDTYEDEGVHIQVTKEEFLISDIRVNVRDRISIHQRK